MKALLVNVSIEVNRVSPDQTALMGAICSTLFVEEARIQKHLSIPQKQTNFVILCALRAKYNTLLKDMDCI